MILASCAVVLALAPQQDPVPPRPDTDAVQERPAVPLTMSRERAIRSAERALDFLVGTQKENGGWGNDAPDLMELGFALNTTRAWRVASHSLVCMALRRGDETPKRRASLDAAVRWLVDAELPRRDSDWDIDYVWSSLYGFVATLELMRDERFRTDEWRGDLTRRANEFLAVLKGHQALSGGWAYYDDPPFNVKPTWATSFCTALVLPAIHGAGDVGIEVEPKIVERAITYLERCALPTGAYTYDLTPVTRLSGVEHINLMEGSLGRTQVGHWARRTIGDRRVTDEVIREGLEHLFEKHAYLDHVRLRPIPHEGFHANAGYFYYFAHFYASEAIQLLPANEREPWHARLRPHLVKTQRENGSCSDFLGAEHLVNASTAFLAMSLLNGLEEDPR